MFYITQNDENGVYIGSYSTKELARLYASVEPIEREPIMTQDVGFPIPDLVVTGFGKRHTKGRFAKGDHVPDTARNHLYARAENNDWIRVRCVDTLGISKLKNTYTECILVSPATMPCELTPEQILRQLAPGNINTYVPTEPPTYDDTLLIYPYMQNL